MKRAGSGPQRCRRCRQLCSSGADRATVASCRFLAQTGSNTFAINRRLVDRVVTVTEDELAVAIFRLHEQENAVIEGAGAAALAACLAGKIPELAGRRVVVPLTGRNIDPAVHARALWRARVALNETALAA